MKNLLGNLALAAGSLVLTLGLLEIMLAFMPVTGVARTQVLSSTGRPFDVASTPNASVTYSDTWRMRNPLVKATNNFGFFSDFDYTPRARIVVAIGDSYTEAAQVEFENTFHQRAARLTGHEIYNFGLSGAPLSQYEAYLDQACATFQPQAAVFAVIHNDFDESFRAHRSRAGFFHYADNAPHALAPTPYEISTLRRLVTKSNLVRYLFFNMHLRHYVRTYTSGSSSNHNVEISFSGSSNVDIRIKRAAIDRFLAQVGEKCLDPSQIIFLADSDRESLYTGITRRDAAMLYFLETARAGGFQVVDLHTHFAAAWRKHGKAFETSSDAHWDRSGHRVVGEALAEVLSLQRFKPDPARRTTARAAQQ
ncbi:MAG: SGNH/GDSL hydrolase family protein [Pseudomonadota bacterium]